METYEYASIEHVTLTVLWRTMMRRGAAHALDVDDYHPEDQCLEIVHRPDTDTPIKNGKRGQRLVALSGKTCNLLDDWLRDRRPDVTDDHGRTPLLASVHGRLAPSSIARYCYKWTRPCVIGRDCPHGRDVDTCQAAGMSTPARQRPTNTHPNAHPASAPTRSVAGASPTT